MIYSYAHSLLVKLVHVLNERPATGSVVPAAGMVFKNWFCVIQSQNRDSLVTKLKHQVFRNWHVLRLFVF